MESIHAIIVDDEQHCLESLQLKLGHHCPQVEVIKACQGSAAALEEIPALKPDLVFLDIQMPGMNGFELLKALPAIDFALVFTTAFDEFAIQAFKVSALDYLLKPIDPSELKRVVEVAQSQRERRQAGQKIDLLLENLRDPLKGFKKVALPTMEGLEFVEPEEIVHCESEGNYSRIQMNSKANYLISRTLKDVEEMLSPHSFLRVHHSHLVNLNHVSKYVRGSGGYLVMSNGDSVKVSRAKKEDLLKLFS